MIRASVLPVLACAVLLTGAAAPQPPKPVKTCADISSAIEADGSMTMEAFKGLLKGAGLNVDARAEASLNGQCQLVGRVQNIVLTQRVLDLPGGGEARVTAKVVSRDGVCRLAEIKVTGCG